MAAGPAGLPLVLATSGLPSSHSLRPCPTRGHATAASRSASSINSQIVHRRGSTVSSNRFDVLYRWYRDAVETSLQGLVVKFLPRGDAVGDARRIGRNLFERLMLCHALLYVRSGSGVQKTSSRIQPQLRLCCTSATHLCLWLLSRP